MKRIVRLLTTVAALSGSAGTGEITFAKPAMRWLWGGFGFHNSEATMLRVMTDEFRDERVYKTFREVSPTYARVFAGFSEWPKEMMDSFADYYDATFRGAGTTIYMVPGRFPYVDADFDPKAHFEGVARNVEYLVKERKLTKLRYYAIANELSAGNTYAWFSRAGKMDLYAAYCGEMYRAFRRHGLDIGLQTTDTSGVANARRDIAWATKTIDEITDTYCWHVYDHSHVPGEPGLYDYIYTNCQEFVRMAGRKEKRLSLGEFGFQGRSPIEPRGAGSGVMRDDGNFSFRYPEAAALGALSVLEMSFAAFNAGCISAVKWTMFDYPDPFLRENGDTPAEKARYDVARYSGHGLPTRYNKCGVIRWDDENHDYSARAELYTLGYFAKLFRKGGRMLPWTSGDAKLIAAGITNPDGSASFAIINWGEAKEVRVKSEHRLDKPLRIYEYDSARPPCNAFNDLQPAKGVVKAEGGAFTVAMPAKSAVFLTTDYIDRVPSEIGDVAAENGRLAWAACEDPEHVYYRVFRNGRQIRSTVATSCAIDDRDATYTVKSVDKWGNARP